MSRIQLFCILQQTVIDQKTLPMHYSFIQNLPMHEKKISNYFSHFLFTNQLFGFNNLCNLSTIDHILNNAWSVFNNVLQRLNNLPYLFNNVFLINKLILNSTNYLLSTKYFKFQQFWGRKMNNLQVFNNFWNE